MRTKHILLFPAIIAIAFSCGEDDTIEDPVYEFVSFAGNPSVNLNEADNSTAPYPLVAQLYAFQPYSEDIDLTIETTGTNASSGTDFSVSTNTVKIKAGSLVSDTIWVTTIDNTAGSTEDRSFNVKIASASKSDILIGLGPTEKKNAAITFNILDDECSLTTDIYNGDLQNVINYGSGDVIKPATGTVAGTQFTATGNLIDYTDYTLIMTLTPNSPGATKGSATFGTYYAGVASDSYEYQFEQVDNGTYDVCSGTIHVKYDIYYMDGGWVYWYTVDNTYSPM
jgi:hypothetical protein